MSKGELKIASLLSQNRIQYSREVSFKGLNGFSGVPLRFDFAIYNQGKLACLIEYDGEQHFKFTPYFHKTKGDFRKQVMWDEKKNNFCLKHNIPLIRVPYWSLENLTLNDMFYNPAYRVRRKDHNSWLGVRK